MILFIFVGCALPRFKGDNFRDIEKAPVSSEKATVYVYRVGQGNPVRLGAVMIFVDDMNIFHVRDKGFTWFLIAPGPHRFKAEWPWDEKPLFEEGHFEPRFLSLNLEAGKTYHINYKILQDTKPITFSESMSLLGKAMSKSHVISVGLVVEAEAEALKNLEVCGYQANNMK
jgi:hypothetical protein